MTIATAVDATTSIVINIPNNYNIKSDNRDFEVYLTDAILDYIEMKEDIELRKSLKNDKEFQDLNKKFEAVLWDL